MIGILRDEGVSGSNGLETRQALPDALALIRSRKANALAVYRLNRLARDLVLQETILAEVRKIGGDVLSTDGVEQAYLKDDPEEPSRRLIRQILGAVSEYERSIISLRLRSGRRRKAEKGGFAYGAPPYGSRAVDGQLADDAHEQLALALMVRLRRDGAPLWDICRALDDAGFRPRRGATWRPTSVKRILDRQTLARHHGKQLRPGTRGAKTHGSSR